MCEAITRAHASSFYFASFPLPKPKKCAAFAIYAFCRWVDDTIDEATNPDQLDPRTLFTELDALYSGASHLPFALAFAEVSRQYSIPKAFYVDLIQGCCMDRQPLKIPSYPELEVYCYYVASIVGLMMSKVFGLKEMEGMYQAVEMGIAMQLTNILRDVKEDAQKNRRYLPLDELKMFHLSENQLSGEMPCDEKWQQFMQFQVERAQAYYHAAEPGLALLANDGSRMTVQLMAKVYGGILDEVRRNHYDVFSGRLYVPKSRKICLALPIVAKHVLHL